MCSMDYKQRRESILSNFAKAKTDLENLNAEIQAEMDDNVAQMQSLAAKNKELQSLKTDNDSSIKTFSKFLK
jgi:hypothetical protein|nr:MAG TPA: hypothetical protein [Bacteriophage sp.]